MVMVKLETILEPHPASIFYGECTMVRLSLQFKLVPNNVAIFFWRFGLVIKVIKSTKFSSDSSLIYRVCRDVREAKNIGVEGRIILDADNSETSNTVNAL